MSSIVGQGWRYMVGAQKQHYFIVTDARPQIVTCLCGTFSTHPGIVDSLSAETPERKTHNDCKACRRKLEKQNKATRELLERISHTLAGHGIHYVNTPWGEAAMEAYDDVQPMREAVDPALRQIRRIQHG